MKKPITLKKLFSNYDKAEYANLLEIANIVGYTTETKGGE